VVGVELGSGKITDVPSNASTSASMENNTFKAPDPSQGIFPPGFNVLSFTKPSYISLLRHEEYFDENPLILDPVILQVCLVLHHIYADLPMSLLGR